MNEKYLLLFVLIFGYTIAPFFSNRLLLNHSRTYSIIHIISLIFIIIAILLNIPQLTILWPIFCCLGLFLFCKIRMACLFQGFTFIGLFPFGFSILSSIWFYCGINNYYLLGYNQTWSYYAALHGCFIGWLFLSGITFLSEKNKDSKMYPYLSLSIVIIFLLIAFGIFGSPIIKRIGVIGYSLLLPFSLWNANKLFQSQNFISISLARCSIFFLCFTLIFALLHEFYLGFPRYIYGYSLMVLLHGITNAFIVIPCFLSSLLLAENKSRK